MPERDDVVLAAQVGDQVVEWYLGAHLLGAVEGVNAQEEHVEEHKGGVVFREDAHRVPPVDYHLREDDLVESDLARQDVVYHLRDRPPREQVDKALVCKGSLFPGRAIV